MLKYNSDAEYLSTTTQTCMNSIDLGGARRIPTAPNCQAAPKASILPIGRRHSPHVSSVLESLPFFSNIIDQRT